ncbi:tetratricopeptide repeat protein [Francisella philomiragia]|uniref:Sel1 repeat family protein n=1 Tax=Francisella philomiragia TaxID=28110 RepID=A0A0B6D3S0_9GAMM|nr:tetratricopeptide repeat protein [Francisella philomiragia]AJI52323.1 sel1 repeat family protein [Francisella philomiragia]MBY7733743.1 SEL1-like repeat protein [Francisella philomiragia]
MSELENSSKKSKKITHIRANRKNILGALLIVAVISGGVYGINSYLDYRHNKFLKEYNAAITDIKNHNSNGYNNAFSILKEIVDNNEATAQDFFYLGYSYQYGLGTEKNYFDAYKYYKKSASLNYPQAFYQIGTLYKDGLGVNKDNKKAIEYFKKSYDLGYKNSIVDLANIINSNNNLISTTDPEILYEIYLAYKDGKLPNENDKTLDKYIITAAANGYEPAIIVQARNFTDKGDNYRALMLWQTLLYSSDPKVAELAKKEIVEVENLVKQERLKTLEKERLKRIEIQQNLRKKQLEDAQRVEQIQKKIEFALSTPKQEITNLNGLIYLNLSKVNKGQLQQFYSDTLKASIDMKLLNTNDNLDYSYIDDFLILSKYIDVRSSLRFDFGEKANSNKYEGIVYLFYNNESKLVKQSTLAAIKNIKVKESSLTPKLINTQEQQLDSSTKPIKEKTKQNKKPKTSVDKIQLTHEEKIQRMQIFAQKGDFRQLYKLEQAAKDGDVYAMYYAGEYYYNVKEYKTALNYFNEAADKGYGPAYYKLASLYYNEEQNGVPYDKEKAMYYYKKAAQLGVRNAQHILMLIE